MKTDRSEPPYSSSRTLLFPSSVSREIDKTYVLSIFSAKRRQSSLLNILSQHNISADLVAPFDRESLTVTDLNCFFTNSKKEGQYHLNRTFTFGELSLAMKHSLVAWDMVYSSFRVCLVLEDDSALSPLTLEILSKLLSDLRHFGIEWDFVFVGDCCDLSPNERGGVRVSEFIWNMTSVSLKTRGAVAYLMHYSGAYKLLTSLPLIAPIDFHINFAQTSFLVFWIEPPLILEGNFSSTLEIERTRSASSA